MQRRWKIWAGPVLEGWTDVVPATVRSILNALDGMRNTKWEDQYMKAVNLTIDKHIHTEHAVGWGVLACIVSSQELLEASLTLMAIFPQFCHDRVHKWMQNAGI